MNEQGGLLGESALDRPVSRAFRLNWEKALYIVLISLALLTRLWGIGDRVQSHDESLHTKYSWDLYVGNGFRHTPLMHGPFLFHATALSYYIFGDNDTSARVVVALLGVAIVAFPWLLRRWLGRAGALVTSLLLLISPSIAYYSRYIRHDIPVIVWFLIALLGAISYLQEGRERWLAVMAGGVALMFCTKEVSFIYSAILGVFLVLAVLVRAALRADGRTRDVLMAGIVTIGLGLCILGLSLALRPAGETRLAWWGVAGAGLAGAAFSLTVVVAGIASARALAARWRAKRVGWPPAVLGLIVGWVVLGLLLTLLLPLLQAVGSCAGQPDGTASLIGCARASLAGQPPAGRVQVVMLALTLAGVGLLAAVWLLTTALPNERSFDLVIVLGTLCLPFLTPLLVHLAGSDPTDYGQPTITYSGAMLIAVVVLSAAVGLLWDLQRQSLGRRPWVWLTSASIFYAITVVLFTTVFTNGSGIATGFIGSLGYWLAQHDVKRGG